MKEMSTKDLPRVDDLFEHLVAKPPRDGTHHRVRFPDHVADLLAVAQVGLDGANPSPVAGGDPGENLGIDVDDSDADVFPLWPGRGR